jgi:sugar phosphate isomerase/epimerase
VSTIVSRAAEYGFDGVDFRGCQGVMNIYERPEFSSNVKETVRRFKDAGLELPCFSSSVCVFCRTDEEREARAKEVRAYATLCGHFGTSFIRIFFGQIGATPRNEAIDVVASNLEPLLRIAKEFGVQLLVETHDDWSGSEHVRAVLEKVGSDRIGVIWDIHHPYWEAGEKPAETWTAIGRWIRYTHWKDSVPKPEAPRGHQLCLVGEGKLPLREFFTCLESHQYDGYLALEWEKKWVPELDEPEVAFPRYVAFMRKLMKG